VKDEELETADVILENGRKENRVDYELSFKLFPISFEQ
jgi:hypothetical protein